MGEADFGIPLDLALGALATEHATDVLNAAGGSVRTFAKLTRRGSSRSRTYPLPAVLVGRQGLEAILDADVKLRRAVARAEGVSLAYPEADGAVLSVLVTREGVVGRGGVRRGREQLLGHGDDIHAGAIDLVAHLLALTGPYRSRAHHVDSDDPAGFGPRDEMADVVAQFHDGDRADALGDGVRPLVVTLRRDSEHLYQYVGDRGQHPARLVEQAASEHAAEFASAYLVGVAASAWLELDPAGVPRVSLAPVPGDAGRVTVVCLATRDGDTHTLTRPRTDGGVVSGLGVLREELVTPMRAALGAAVSS